MLERCSTRLSTPPSEVARFHTASGAGDGGRPAATDLHRQHATKPALHLARGDSVAGSDRLRLEAAGAISLQ
jgi:hypothetical protein